MNRFTITDQLQSIAIVSALIAVVLLFGSNHSKAREDKQPPAIGEMAPKLELQSYSTGTIKLEEAIRRGPVVVMVLRGNPGYQCPLCSRQVGQFVASAKELRAASATVIMVYPGPEAQLKVKAREFLKDTRLPDGFHLLIDPDYAFTNTWHLRWDAPRETAYPATFVVDTKGKIRFAKVSKSHGDRAQAEEVITRVTELGRD